MCDIIIERIDIKMRQKDETKQAEIMRALYSMRNTGHFPSLEVEEESPLRSWVKSHAGN